MSAQKERLAQAAELLDMYPAELLMRLDPPVGPGGTPPKAWYEGPDTLVFDGDDDEPWPADSPEGEDVAAMRALDDAPADNIDTARDMLTEMMRNSAGSDPEWQEERARALMAENFPSLSFDNVWPIR